MWYLSQQEKLHLFIPDFSTLSHFHNKCVKRSILWYSICNITFLCGTTEFKAYIYDDTCHTILICIIINTIFLCQTRNVSCQKNHHFEFSLGLLYFFCYRLLHLGKQNVLSLLHQTNLCLSCTIIHLYVSLSMYPQISMKFAVF
jgi:hypothetical protein